MCREKYCESGMAMTSNPASIGAPIVSPLARVRIAQAEVALALEALEDASPAVRQAACLALTALVELAALLRAHKEEVRRVVS